VLLNIKSKLEHYYKDALDIDFTIQEGQLYILGCRREKCNAKAHIKICVDLLLEGIISPDEMLKRISLNNIISYLQPTIATNSNLPKFTTGMPVVPGGATGILIRNKEDLINTSDKYILIKSEICPEDIDLMRQSEGIITQHGGITSHAALIARGWGKPCIVGCEDLIFSDNFILNTKGDKIKAGQYITIDSTNGNIYKGKGKIHVPNWKLDPYILIIYKYLKTAIQTNNLPQNHIGECWLIWDYLIHLMMPKTNCINKNSVNAPAQYISFEQPDKKTISKIWKSLATINQSDIQEYTQCIQGLRQTLIRLMSNKMGISNHYKYYRPLFDPLLYVKYDNPETNNHGYSNEQYYRQLVGEEFYDISKTLSFLPKIDKINLYFENRNEYEFNLCFLDYTNPNGESLVDKTYEISKFKIMVNDALVSYEDFPLFYHIIRREEYFYEK